MGIRKTVSFVALAIASIGAVAFADAGTASADTYGQTSCGYNPEVAQAEYGEQNATFNLDRAYQQREEAFMSAGQGGTDISLYQINFAQAQAMYNQAKDYADHVKAAAEAACPRR